MNGTGQPPFSYADSRFGSEKGGCFHASRGGEISESAQRPDAQDFPYGLKGGISGLNLSYIGH